VFKWLGGGEKVDHPLADAKRAREIVDEISAAAPAKALGDAVDWLESVAQTAEFKIEARIDAIEIIELAARKHQQRLLDIYFAVGSENKFQENRLYAAATKYWKTLGDAHVQCVAEIDSAKSIGAPLKPRIPLVVARGLRALTQQLKWVQFRYGKIDAGMWKNISALYNYAEASSIVEHRMELYPGVKPATSVRNEFLRAMMLWTASPGSLSPVKQDVVEWVAGYFADKFFLQLRPEAEYVYFFDLDKTHAPQRWTSQTSATPGARYFDAGDARNLLKNMMDSTTAVGALPSEVDLGPNRNIDITIEVLRHLLSNWSCELPVRASEWRNTAMTLTVVHGFEVVVGAIAPELGDGLDFTEALAHETWVAENVSQGGYGAVVPAGKDDWVQVGVLVGIKSEKEKNWSVGLIRRVKSDDYGQRRVGIQLVSRTALSIQLRSSGAGGRVRPAILLNAEPSASGSMHVLVPHNAFTLRDNIIGMYGADNERRCTLEPAGVLETGSDFIWARFIAEFNLG
jgi:hypothetical protein